MKKVLILGATGAMGLPLIELLVEKGEYYIVATSRKKQECSSNVEWVQGDAHEIGFLQSLLTEYYDAIFDFMVWKPKDFSCVIKHMLHNTSQYFFFSSGRVYAQSEVALTEESPLLLDITNDEEYLKTDEYALAKAREEKILYNQSKQKNWTIIRPYITYNSQRLQLGVYEKEYWLYRALRGRTVVFPNDIGEKVTTMTCAKDVAKNIVALIGQEKALGETYHTVTEEYMSWNDILRIYMDVFYEETGMEMKVIQPDTSEELLKQWRAKKQIEYDRLYNRWFDNSKIMKTVTEMSYLGVKDGLTECLTEFINHPNWIKVDVEYEAWANRITKERMPMCELKGVRNKWRYFKNRYLVGRCK